MGCHLWTRPHWALQREGRSGYCVPPLEAELSAGMEATGRLASGLRIRHPPLNLEGTGRAVGW